MKKNEMAYDLISKKTQNIPADTQTTTLNMILHMIKWASLSLPTLLLA